MIYVAAFDTDTQSIFHLALQRSCFIRSNNVKYRIICKNNIAFISFETVSALLSKYVW